MRNSIAVIFTLAGLSFSSVAQAQIVSYWSFDADASDSNGAHDGTLVGGAAITNGSQGFGGSGEALQLNTEGDYVDLANPSTFDFNGDFTWHAYIKTTDISGALFSRNPDGTAWNQGSKALFVRDRAGIGEVEWDTGWVANPRTFVSVSDDNWHQVIATYVAATDQLDVFVDPIAGATNGQFSGVHDVNRFDEHSHVHNGALAETSFTIGRADFSGGLASLDALIGLIDEAAVFDTALTGAELDQLITSGPGSFLSPVTTFTGDSMDSDSDVAAEENWDNGLPTNGTRRGIVPDGFPSLNGPLTGLDITFEGTSGYDGPGLDSGSNFNATFVGTGNSNFTDDGIVLDSASVFAWDSNGTATTRGIEISGQFSISAGMVDSSDHNREFQLEGGTLLVSGGLLRVEDDLNIDDGLVNQTGGDVVSTGGWILIGEDSPGALATWSLSDGSVQAGDIQFGEPNSRFLFPAGSTGVLRLESTTVAGAEALIAAGQIATDDPQGLEVGTVNIDGTDFTRVRVAPIGMAEVTWDTPQNITGPGDIITTGTLIAAVNGDNGGDVVVDPGGLNLTFTPDNTLFTNNPFTTTYAPTTGDAGFDAVLNRADWSPNNPNSQDVIVDGLQVGESYAIQFFVADTRDCCNSRSMEITGGGNTANVYMGDLGGSPNPAQYVVGRFIAEQTTQLFNFVGTHATAGNLRHPQFNAYVLRTDTPAMDIFITEFTFDQDTDQFTITWNSEPDTRYTVYWTGDMTDWDTGGDVGDGILATGDSTAWPFDHPDSGASELFFRVEEDPLPQ